MQFTEVQYFRQWWLLLIMVFTLCFPAVAIYREHQFFVFTDYIAGIGIPLVVFMLLMFVLRLETAVDEQGIHYRFFPFHITTRLKTWDEIDKAYVRKYNPILEYGGWGLKMGFGNGMALNVSGNIGLQIVYKTGKTLLIGTKKGDELDAIMKGYYERGVVKGEEPGVKTGDRF